MASFSDNFDRGDGDLTSPWVQNSMGGGGAIGIDTNKVTRTSAGSDESMAHHTDDHGPNVRLKPTSTAETRCGSFCVSLILVLVQCATSQFAALATAPVTSIACRRITPLQYR